MDSTLAPRPRPRPAHTQGTTRCAYTPDGGRLVTVGSNNTIRIYTTGSDGEPTNIDECQEQNIAVATSKSDFVVGSEDGTVSLFSLGSATFERFLLRTTLPIRDVALTENGKWCAVTSDELSVKIVNTQNINQVLHLREHGRPARHASFDPKASVVALSGTDGIIYIYSLTSEEPELIRKVDGVIGALDSDSTATSKVAWHPDGRAFAVPTPTRDIQVISKNDWEKQRCFENGHLADITALAWSPNGAMLASAGKDGKILIWETKTQSVLHRYDYSNVIDLCWHPRKNILSFTTTDGEVYIYPDFLSDQFAPLLKLGPQPAPFIHDPLSEISGNRQAAPNGQKAQELPTRQRRESFGSLDSYLGGNADDDDFVVDDDNAGYAPTNLKRGREEDHGYGGQAKRRHMPEAIYHESFQPGSTPWRGNRKYLCLNLIGFVWTINQDSHHTVTVEFYDHEFQRDFHFTDTFHYDKACLNERGTLFSCPPKDDQPAIIYYRPHESWTQRLDWRIELPRGEGITAMSLSDSFITVTTSANYVRVYTLFGVPYRVYRPKSTPMVTCASWRDYVLTVGNGPVGPDGNTRLLYTIENVKRDEICQNEDTLALPPGDSLKSVFFSDNGVSHHSSLISLSCLNSTDECRTRAYTTLPARSSRSSTGASPRARAGCRSSTPSSSRAWPRAAKTRRTFPLPSPTTSSTASSSRAATNIRISRVLCCQNLTFPFPYPRHRKKRHPSQRRRRSRLPLKTTTSTTRCKTKNLKNPRTTKRKPRKATRRPRNSNRPTCSRASKPRRCRTSLTPPPATRRSDRRCRGWSSRLTRRCCSSSPASAARARRGACARWRWWA